MSFNSLGTQGGIKRPADGLVTGLDDIARGSQEPILNMGAGGSTEGYTPELDTASLWSGYRPQQLITRVLDLPKLFSRHQNSAFIKKTTIQMLETYPTRVSGLKSTRTVEVSEGQLGGTGQPWQEPRNVKRSPSVLNTEYDRERYGEVIGNHCNFWAEYAIMHPNTKRPTAANMFDLDDLTWVQYAATLLCYEPDPTGRWVHRAWLGLNIFPLNWGEMESSKDLNAPKEVPQRSIEWAGAWFDDPPIVKFAQKFHDTTRFLGAHPDKMPLPIDAASADIQALLSQIGYAKQVERVRTGTGM